jgi:hypothetical protein
MEVLLFAASCQAVCGTDKTRGGTNMQWLNEDEQRKDDRV